MIGIVCSILMECSPEYGWSTLYTDACLGPSQYGCGDGLYFQGKMIMKHIRDVEREKVYDTKSFQRADTWLHDQWWVDTMKIFHRNIHTLFGRYQDEIRSRWHDRPESTGIVCGLNHWPFHGSYSWGLYFVWCSWLKLYHHSLGILPAQGSYSSGTYGVVLVYN